MAVRPIVGVALTLLVAGGSALAWAATTASAVNRPIRATSKYLATAQPRAAAAAYGRRVLLIHTPPLEAARGDVYESARAPGGWELYDAAPAAAPRFAAAMARVAAAAARDWEAGRSLSAKMVRQLAEAGIALVFVEDGRRIVSPEGAADGPGVSPEASVPGLRVRRAEPVMRVADAEAGPSEDGQSTDGEVADGGAESVSRLEIVTQVRDFEDGLWGGRVVVEVETPGRHVFAWPAEGARVTVNGVAVAAQVHAEELPLLALDLEVGDARVEVSYADSRGRTWAAGGGALALVVGVLSLMLAFRPHPDRGDEADDENENDGVDRGAAVEGNA